MPIGRFINADGYVSTGQGILGNNMYAYCGNNPVIYVDELGASKEWFLDKWKKIKRFFQESFSAGVIEENTYKEIESSTIFGGSEIGESSSKVVCGDISKPVSVYAIKASEWWKIWEYKIGMQLNIRDGGVSFAYGVGEASAILSYDKTSYEVMYGMNKIGSTVSYDVDFKERTAGRYYHEYIRTWSVAVAIVVSYYAGGTVGSFQDLVPA